MTILFTLLKEDVIAAMQARAKGGLIPSSCPVFQALKREGHHPKHVAYHNAYLREGYFSLSDTAYATTSLHSDEWNKISTPQVLSATFVSDI